MKITLDAMKESATAGREKKVYSLSGLIGGDAYRLQQYCNTGNSLMGNGIVMAMAMAVPAFADFDNGTTHTYHIKNNTIAGDYVYLNLYGTGGVYASRDVTVYPRTTSDDQVL